jgi:non-canonical (house-cleaning) NTP pyrophosphatase
MDKILVAVGSLRRPKLEAAREALAAISAQFQPRVDYEVIGVDVPSGVGHTPLSREEMITGARQRAENLARHPRAAQEGWKYFAGLEGGIDVIHDRGRRIAFLENWACVIDTSGAISYGQSGAIALPESLAITVVDRGVELSVAIDEFAGQQGIRDAQGAWGVLTNNLITRQEAFRISFINAFAPFRRR